MSDNVTTLPVRDLIEEMKGADFLGSAVVIDGREIPGMAMFVREGRDEIEFVIDHRVAFGFSKATAWDAAAFALAAMAYGAGCDPLNFEPRPFAKKVVHLGKKEAGTLADLTPEPANEYVRDNAQFGAGA